MYGIKQLKANLDKITAYGRFLAFLTENIIKMPYSLYNKGILCLTFTYT